MKIIAKAAPAAFGVYLIHEHPYIRDTFLVGRLVRFANGSLLKLIAVVIAAAVAVFLACLAVDLLRLRLFGFLGVREKLERLEQRIWRVQQEKT